MHTSPNTIQERHHLLSVQEMTTFNTLEASHSTNIDFYLWLLAGTKVAKTLGVLSKSLFLCTAAFSSKVTAPIIGQGLLIREPRGSTGTPHLEAGVS